MLFEEFRAENPVTLMPGSIGHQIDALANLVISIVSIGSVWTVTSRTAKLISQVCAGL